MTPQDLAPQDHAQHLQELARMIDRHEQHSLPLGDAQLERRAAEQAARSAAAGLVGVSHSQADVARALHLTPQTLSNWMNHSDSQAPRGRPPAPLDPVARTAVNELLDSHGRSIGLPALKRCFPDVPRAALHDLRDRWDEQHDVEPAHLAWLAPGSVWAADFTETPVPVDGLFDQVLLVRDLPSGFILLAAPCAAQSAEIVMLHCRQLFRRHGPPLVLKTDNGSPFTADGTRALCSAHGVLNLLSPPLTPPCHITVQWLHRSFRGAVQNPRRHARPAPHMRRLDQRHPQSRTPRRQRLWRIEGAFDPLARGTMAAPQSDRRAPASCARRRRRPALARNHRVDSTRTQRERIAHRTFSGMPGDGRPHRDPPGSRRAWLPSDPETHEFVHPIDARFIQKLAEQYNLRPMTFRPILRNDGVYGQSDGRNHRGYQGEQVQIRRGSEVGASEEDSGGDVAWCKAIIFEEEAVDGLVATV